MQQFNNRIIIVVDDEKDIVQSYLDVLTPLAENTPKRTSRGRGKEATSDIVNVVPDQPYEILRAYSGEEAIEILKKEIAAGKRVAGGFFDVKMEGGMDGIQTIQEIWKLDPDVHCTIVTAYHDRSVEDIDQLFGVRFKDQWDYLNKPFTIGEILQKARQMTSGWNRKRTLENTLKELQNTQAQLVQSERLAAIAQVARGVGHEFGNILQRIVGKADLALSESQVEKIHADLSVILQAAERASVIVRNLQSFSRTQPSTHAGPIPVDMRKAIGDTLGLVNHELKKNSVEFKDCRKPCSPVTGSPVELQQVLMNLVINAIHAMPKGGSIEMGCEDEGKFVKTWVRDSGVGIPSDVLPHIFEYAFTTKGEQGSGLGLSISKQIIESHGGTLSVDSIAGKGSTFTISIPQQAGGFAGRKSETV